MTPLLSARALTRRFGALKAVEGVTLDLDAGQIHAVIGTNGAGKSTLINLLSGELPASGGTVQLDGQDITTWSQPRRAQAGLGRSYQRNNIFLPLTVLTSMWGMNIMLPRFPGGEMIQFWWVCGIMGGIATVMLLLFRLNRWI